MSQNDWRELIESLTAQNVEFLVVGSTVLAFYARPRFTEDLDLWVRSTRENVERLQEALRRFGLPIVPESFEPFIVREDQVVAIGAKPFAVDLFNSIKGLEFEEAWQNKVPGELFGSQVFYLGLEDFVRSKKAADRPKDRADLAILDEVQIERDQGSGNDDHPL